MLPARQVSERGMALHPQAEAFLQCVVREQVPPVSTLSPEEARTWDAKMVALLTKRTQWAGRTESVQVPGPSGDIPVRKYIPILRTSQHLLYFHGGGWVVGNLDQVEYTCRLLATKTRRTVISVDYRLAPEYKFPAAVEDCYAVTKWVAENADGLGGKTDHLAVCGDSAGGNLAAAVSLMAADRRGPYIANQILIYPIVDLSDQNYRDYPDELSPALTKSDMNWFITHYISRNEDLQDQYASPILRHECAGLPHAFFITAEYDILTKQCNTYADRLKEAGVRVNYAHYAGLIHGFFTLPDAFDAAHDAVNRIAAELSTNGSKET
jgi:acetyl esterase